MSSTQQENNVPKGYINIKSFFQIQHEYTQIIRQNIEADKETSVYQKLQQEKNLSEMEDKKTQEVYEEARMGLIQFEVYQYIETPIDPNRKMRLEKMFKMIVNNDFVYCYDIDLYVDLDDIFLCFSECGVVLAFEDKLYIERYVKSTLKVYNDGIRIMIRNLAKK